MEYYVGIDLGTSSVKLMLLNEEGKIENTVTEEYPIYYPKSGWSEQNPRDWWEAIKSKLPKLLTGFDGQSVRGIGVAGQMHGLVVLDEEDNIIRPAILWNDGRTDKETSYLNEIIGKERLFELTGNIAFAGFTAPKIMWLRENESESFKKIKKIMLPKDYINYMLTGVHCTDYSDASGMLILDVKNKRWSSEMLRILGIEEEVMPRLYESFEPVGTIKKEIADCFGINEGAIVAAGAGDNAAAAVGTATVGVGKCNISLGTSGTIFVSSDSFSADSRQAIHAFCHADGGYHLMGCILSAASCSKWFLDEILKTKEYQKEAAEIKPERLGENQVFFLPYLMGERSPINDTSASGTFIGLRPDTSRADMYQAILEGVAFAIRDNLEIIRRLGVDVKRSFLCGGGAKSDIWRIILANVLGIELEIPKSEQGPGMGGAMLAMVAGGKYESVKAVSENICGVSDRIYPSKELSSKYEEKYEKFKKIYPRCKELFAELR